VEGIESFRRLPVAREYLLADIGEPLAYCRVGERMLRSGEIDKRHGARVRYANPINGGPVLPTMSAQLALFPKGFKGEQYRATDGAVFVCAEGSGTTTVDGKVLEWGPNDVFAHTAGKESVLFSISDRPSQEALGIWREDASLH
jgi:gentisate 1,2-dioxygenase